MLLLICNRELLFIGKRKDEDDMAKSTKTYRTITQKRLQLELPTENSVYSQENRNRAENYAHLTSENGK